MFGKLKIDDFKRDRIDENSEIKTFEFLDYLLFFYRRKVLIASLCAEIFFVYLILVDF